MDESYEKTWKALLKSKEDPGLQFWDVSGASIPQPLDYAIEDLMSREALAGKLAEVKEPTIGKIGSIKAQGHFLSCFERDCRARHSVRADAYSAALLEHTRLAAAHERLAKLIKNVE